MLSQGRVGSEIVNAAISIFVPENETEFFETLWRCAKLSEKCLAQNIYV